MHVSPLEEPNASKNATTDDTNESDVESSSPGTKAYRMVGHGTHVIGSESDTRKVTRYPRRHLTSDK